MDDPWPTEIPWSLWSYQSLTAGDIPQVPLMGVSFEPGFIYAFAFGCIFVAFFSWQRFRYRDNDVKADSEALRKLQPTDLGGRNSLVRAYFIYAGSVLLLYISLTFFGKLIFQATQMIPVAGISVDVAQLKFDSPQWPLTLAFAFAGLAELLPPLKLAEGWLRNRAYRAAGIPVRLEQTVRSLIATLENPPRSETKEYGDKERNIRSGSLHLLLQHYSENWRAQIESSARARETLNRRISRYEELVKLLSQIELLIGWAKTARGRWPGAEVSFQVRQTEMDFVNKADKLLNEFQQRLHESGSSERIETPLSRARFDQYLTDVISRASGIRLELVSILAIFIERDPDVPKPQSGVDPKSPRTIEALADLLQNTERPDSMGSGPEAGLLILLIPVFLIYAAGAWQGAVELVGQYVETTNLSGVLLTALIETIKIASLTWLPLLAAFSLRQYLWDTGDWAGSVDQKTHRTPSRFSQMFGCLGLALAASLICLTCVAMLKAFSIAQNANYFKSLLFEGKIPFILYYSSLAVTVISLVPLCISAADARANGRSALPYAFACAVAVLFLYTYHGMFWDAGLGEKCSQVSSLTTSECTRRSDALSRVILSALAFLSTWMLGGPASSRVVHHLASVKTITFAGFAAVLSLAQAAPSPASAQEKPKEKPVVVIGFRNDVEPFSYRLGGDGNEERYGGYIADICYKIFEGSDYPIKATEVNAGDRFARINWEEKEVPKKLVPEHLISKKLIPKRVVPAPRLNLLCDAVTMKFDDELENGEEPRSKNIIYSPVVFATGVSYLTRPARGATTKGGDVSLGYVLGTTAANVALKACEVDLFKALPPTQRKAAYQRCHFMYEAAIGRRKMKKIKQRQSTLMPYHVIAPVVTAADELIKSAKQFEDTDSSSFSKLPSYAMAFNLQEMFSKCRNPSGSVASYCDAFEDVDKITDALDDTSCPINNERSVKRDSERDVDSKKQESWRDYHFCPMEDHTEIIAWLCEDTASTRRVYLGDREIILGKLNTWNKEKSSCVVEQPDGAEYLTYEPYALLINKNNAELVQFVQKRVYQIFSHRATATALFSSYFPHRKMSAALAYLFLLNEVEPEEQ